MPSVTAVVPTSAHTFRSSWTGKSSLRTRLHRGIIEPCSVTVSGFSVGVRHRRDDDHWQRARKGCVHSVTTSPHSMAPTTLITFDVDGTLIHSVGEDANKFHKLAFSHAFKTVHGIDASIDEIPHHGSTDKLVAADTLRHRGVPEEDITTKMDEYISTMIEYARQNREQASTGIQILPGVIDLLKVLHDRDDMLIALVTGNLEPIGWIKMEELGLLPYFSSPNFGGFGTDHTDRGELVKIAAERARSHGWTGDNHWHVGDTPKDILAAEYGGAKALGVCTGVFGKEELEKSSKNDAVILPDLTDFKLVEELFEGMPVL
uniref:Phosphoglycolate phosphatase n=1 Tax=Pyramimonas obovata TaxID=1411642 RepID=A0A7S0QZI5_9CHLO|mmetsp:Transcript_20158/g.44151  ORF Transcript_20158/g.44151 Transcript_20158/m.44151 type:complete len:318 (+) Transcript_20158:81-1034(+)|eukprot:CAMPEP_0118923268 /NCGR_PEP_ID=MMETSP1169-20130426/1860_1 /TAXON_ID=36882 /ORGANISM="Pyramimonas obovata, Strain CCMP722" /LENGTH=317 /DNA_ID=CAMNT_0006864235 /DNA_START=44 /DNA_END=997 /DNA_ORIENTATION=-